jgi:hypothetical protein
VEANSEARQSVQSLLARHGLSLVVHGEWLLTGGNPPAVRLLWSETRENGGRLDVQVLLDDDRVVLESFAGLGQDSVALQDAIANFSMNSLHVLLSALWGISVPDQVTVEEWELSGVRRAIHIGNFGRRKSAGPDVPVPADLFPAIELAIQAEALSPAHHWFRFYVGHVPGRPLVLEALFDNEEWPHGAAALASIDWPSSARFYSVRNFIFVPAAG